MELIFENIHVALSLSSGDVFKLDVPRVAFERGKIVMLLGANGSGKSVLLRTMTGELEGLGRKSEKDAVVSYVRQHVADNLASELSVHEHLVPLCEPNTIRGNCFPLLFLRNEIESILKMYPALEGKLGQASENLSLGQKQLLSFVVATWRMPHLLLLDEYLASTDHRITKELLSESQIIAKRGAAVCIVTHDIHMALDHGDEVYILKDGTLAHQIKRGSTEWDYRYISNQLS